jgi:hypothetical protein
MIPAANSDRLGFCSVTLLSRPRRDTLEANRKYRTRLPIASKPRSQGTLLKRQAGGAALFSPRSAHSAPREIDVSGLYHSLFGLAKRSVWGQQFEFGSFAEWTARRLISPNVIGSMSESLTTHPQRALQHKSLVSPCFVNQLLDRFAWSVNERPRSVIHVSGRFCWSW